MIEQYDIPTPIKCIAGYDFENHNGCFMKCFNHIKDDETRIIVHSHYAYCVQMKIDAEERERKKHIPIQLSLF